MVSVEMRSEESRRTDDGLFAHRGPNDMLLVSSHLLEGATEAAK